MKKLLAIATLIAFVCALPLAAAAPKSVLTQKDIDKFVDSISLITEDLDGLGLEDVDFETPEIESFEGLATILKDIGKVFDKAQAVVTKSKDATAILKAYGYTPATFFAQLRAITYGILAVESEPSLAELVKAKAEYFKMIDADKKRTKAQKDKDKKDYEAMIATVKKMIDGAKALLSAADLALVKKNLDVLKAAFEESRYEEEEGYDPYGYDPYGYDPYGYEDYDPYGYGDY